MLAPDYDLLEKVYDKILTKGNELKGLKKLLFFWAVNLGLNHKYNKKIVSLPYRFPNALKGCFL